MPNLDDMSNALKEMKNMDIKQIDVDTLVDINDIHIDSEIEVSERIIQYLEQVKNPYCFKVGDMVVKVSFRENGKSFQECFSNMISMIV